MIYEIEKLPRFAREGGTWIQTRIKSRELYNESSSFSNDLMTRKSFRALRGRGGDNFNSDEDYFRKRYNESSSFSNDLWNLKSSALRAGGGNLNSDED